MKCSVPGCTNEIGAIHYGQQYGDIDAPVCFDCYLVGMENVTVGEWEAHRQEQQPTPFMVFMWTMDDNEDSGS